MKINKITAAKSVENQSFTSNTKEEKTSTPQQIKDGKRKLLLALAGIAAATVAGIAIYKGKFASSKAGEAVQETAQKADKTVQKTVQKLSGNVDERLAALKSNGYVELVESLSDSQVESLKKLKPEILENINDFALSGMLYGDIEKITETLNGLSKETITALAKEDLLGSVASGLGSKGRLEQLRENITLDILEKAKKAGREYTPEELEERVEEKFWRIAENFESQYKRVKLFDKIIDSDAIAGLSRGQKGNLRAWLYGNGGSNFREREDASFISSFFGALKKDSIKNGNVDFDYIWKIADTL